MYLDWQQRHIMLTLGIDQTYLFRSIVNVSSVIHVVYNFSSGPNSNVKCYQIDMAYE